MKVKKKKIVVEGVRKFSPEIQQAWASEQIAELSCILCYWTQGDIKASELLSFVIRLVRPTFIEDNVGDETNLPTLLKGGPEDKRFNLLVYSILHRMELIPILRTELFIALSKEESHKLNLSVDLIEGLKKFLSVHFPGSEYMDEEAFRLAKLRSYKAMLQGEY